MPVFCIVELVGCGLRSTGGVFLIALARDKAKTFVSISDDDLIDLVDGHAVGTEVMANVHDAIKNLSVGG